MPNEKYIEGLEQEPTIKEQVDLAKAICEANDRRNTLTEQYPDFDDLSVFVNSSPENRREYERLEQEANEAWKNFDKKVTNKDMLIKHLRETGEELLADRISKMFRLGKEQSS